MNIENIDETRKNFIVEIKEKIKKNPRYIHPLNKERQEDMKRLEFTNGYEFISWMQQNGILKSPADIYRKNYENTIKNAGCITTKEYRDKCAQNAGFENKAEYDREYSYKTGRRLPKEFNEDCPVYFGCYTESLMIQTFEGAIRMPNNNPGFDWTCKNGDKIDNKGVCLRYNTHNNWSGWRFSIRYNDIADWFILSAWDNRDSLQPLYVWAFHKNDMVKYRIGRHNVLKKFCNRESIAIPNTPEGLKEFEKYEVTNRLIKLKELCNGQ